MSPLSLTVDRPNVVRTPTFYADLGFTLYATSGTGSVITEAGIPVNILPKLASGQRPNVIDLMKNKDMALVINTPSGKNPREDEVNIRTASMQNQHPHHDHPPWCRCRLESRQVIAWQRVAGPGFAGVSQVARVPESHNAKSHQTAESKYLILIIHYE